MAGRSYCDRGAKVRAAEDVYHEYDHGLSMIGKTIYGAPESE